jgi:DNA-binding protein YbaB
VNDFDDQFRQLSRQVEDQLAAFEERRAAIAEAVGEGQSADGMVSATVAAGGVLKRVAINPRAMRLSSEQLGESVVDAVTAANAELARALQSLGPGTVDVPALMQKVQLPPELRKVMDDFQKRASDIGYNLDKLRRDMESDRW